MRDTQREGQRHRKWDMQAPYREPDVGLGSGTPDSLPEPKAGAQQLNNPRVPLTLCIPGTFSPKARQRVCSIQGLIT